MTCDLPAHCRRNSIQASSYLANRRTGSEPSRDLLALTQREREERAPPDHRNKSTMTRHQTTNGRMLLAEGAPDLMQRVSAFQRHHMSLFCAAESPNRFPWVINTTFGEKTYIRWCCNDRLSSQRLPGSGPAWPVKNPAINGYDQTLVLSCIRLARLGGSPGPG